MSARAISLPARTRTLFHLLELVLVGFALFPFVVFVVRPRRVAEAVSSAGLGRPTVRREMSRVELRDRRAAVRPRLQYAIPAFAIQLIWLCGVAWVGRRWFGLRL